ncbi:MAG: class I SAM-dependent methyltransferase [Alphaproteobacteria bacterium]
MTNSPDLTASASTAVGEIYADGTYLAHNETWHETESPWKAKQIIKLLNRNNLTPSRFCEVGCGAGEILKQLSDVYTSADFVGYEVSPQAFERCKTKAAPRLHYYLRSIFDEADVYDCLLCIDVFEHVEDYMGFVKALKNKATYKVFHIPLDISVLSVLRSSMITSRRRMIGHLHYFTRETAMATLKDCGYEVLDYFYTTTFFGLPSRTWKAKLARLPRQLLFGISQGLEDKLLGGCSLMVLAK